MVPVCDKRYHIYNRFRHFWAEIKKLWNYPLYRSLGSFQTFPKFTPMMGYVMLTVECLHISLTGTDKHHVDGGMFTHKPDWYGLTSC